MRARSVIRSDDAQRPNRISFFRDQQAEVAPTDGAFFFFEEQLSQPKTGRLKMRGAFVIAFGFAILEAFAGLQSASAAAPKCASVNCQVYYGTHGPVTT
jgi:hypothetical protein